MNAIHLHSKLRYKTPILILSQNTPNPNPNSQDVNETKNLSVKPNLHPYLFASLNFFYYILPSKTKGIAQRPRLPLPLPSYYQLATPSEGLCEAMLNMATLALKWIKTKEK